MGYKICVYAISKNEEQFVDRWMDAVSEADMVVVLDTGSQDNTVEKLKSRGAVVHSHIFNPWRFDAARNMALSFVPADMDICVSNDLDEVFSPGWREKLEKAWHQGCTRAKYLFSWGYHADGKPNKQFTMEKIHSRHGFSWVRPVHEVLSYSGVHDKSVWVEGLVLNHYPDLAKPRGQYLPLLALSAEENPEDDRAMFWLGREYMYHGRHEEAIATLKRHLGLRSAIWAEERAASMRYLARCCEALGKSAEALSWHYRAIAECPDTREAFMDFARYAYRVENWPLCYAMAKAALSLSKKSGSYLEEAENWEAAPYDYASISAYRLGLVKQAAELAEAALAFSPQDARLAENLALLQKEAQNGPA